LGVAVAAAAFGGFACAAVLGAKELPLRPTDAGVDGDACSTFSCSPACNPGTAFCDDFENESDSLERWNGGAAGGTGTPITNRPDNHMGIAADPVAKSRMLSADVTEADAATSLIGIENLLRPADGKAPIGVRVRFEMRAPDVDFFDTDAQRYDKFLISFILGDNVRSEGVGIALIEHTDKGHFDVSAVQRGILQFNDNLNELGIVSRVDDITLKSQLFRFELVLAQQKVFDDIGEHCVPQDEDGDPIDASQPDTPPDGLRLLVKSPTRVRCVLLQKSLATPDWIDRVTILAGIAFGGPGHGGVRIDNVAAYFIY
jgi:hypothetical protein